MRIFSFIAMKFLTAKSRVWSKSSYMDFRQTIKSGFKSVKYATLSLKSL